MSRYPGAYWRPSGPDRGTRSRTVGVSLHEAVTTAQLDSAGHCGIDDWNNDGSGDDPYCQYFHDQFGSMAQYLEHEQIAYGVKDGNDSWVTVESWDGLHHDTELNDQGQGANETRWSSQQCERIADHLAWSSLGPAPEHRISLVFTMDSADVGVAPHRAGIAPWRMPDRPVWTRHDGKPCPGDLRVQQIPGIVARAQVIRAAVLAGRCTWLPVGPVNLPAALARTGGPTPKPPAPPIQEDDEMFDSIQKIGPDGKATGAVYVAGPGYWQPIPTQEYYQVLAGKIVKPVRLVNAREFDLLRDWCSRTGVYSPPKA